MLIRRFAVLAVLLMAGSICSLAQLADAGVIGGGSFVSDTNLVLTAPCGVPLCTSTPFTETVKTEKRVFVEGVAGIRMINALLLSIHLEAPVTYIPTQTLTFTGPVGFSPIHLSSLFVTPSIRVKLLPGSSVSPWGSVGGGLARYTNDAGLPAINQGALQFGGGLDIKTRFPLLGFRAEVRDYVSKQPNPGVILFSVQTPSGLSRHNVLAGGGIVLSF